MFSNAWRAKTAYAGLAAALVFIGGCAEGFNLLPDLSGGTGGATSKTVDLAIAAQGNREASDGDIKEGTTRAGEAFTVVSVKIEQHENSYNPPSLTATGYFLPGCDKFYLTAQSVEKCGVEKLDEEYMRYFRADTNNPERLIEYHLLYMSVVPAFDGVGYLAGRTVFGGEEPFAEGTYIFDSEIARDLDEHGTNPNLEATLRRKYIAWAMSHELGHLIGYLHEVTILPEAHHPTTPCLMKPIDYYDIAAVTQPKFCADTDTTDANPSNSCKENVATHLGFAPE